MKKYKNLVMAPRTISIAIFEYLEKRGYKPNRKKGIQKVRGWGGFETGDLMLQVEKEKEKEKEIFPGSGRNLYHRRLTSAKDVLN